MNYLKNGLKDFDCQGYTSCEIGVRQGTMGLRLIMDNVINNYIHVGVDPYAEFKVPTL